VFNAAPVAVEPVGARHAVTVSRPWRALCGLDVSGWHVFSDLAFDPAHSAGCLRCAQLTSGGTAAEAPRPADAPGRFVGR
jgi:hypothetical protein